MINSHTAPYAALVPIPVLLGVTWAHAGND